ncbi:hypothetical protein [Streptomyces milbemycinicus]|uniref:Secreted protein n=1 Tax=Streptomyces milbemycinicus TaxID=476552 RepID=A0ABW8LZM0_9ACTN
MRKKSLLAAVASVGLLTALSSASAHAAAPAPTSAASALACGNWSVANDWGFASGTNCNGTLVDGTVTDNNADGRCPYVRGYKLSGAYDDSDWAGPKGDSSPVRVNATESDPFVRFSLRAIYC